MQRFPFFFFLILAGGMDNSVVGKCCFWDTQPVFSLFQWELFVFAIAPLGVGIEETCYITTNGKAAMLCSIWVLWREEGYPVPSRGCLGE